MSTRKFCLAVLFMHDATGYEIRKIASEGSLNFVTEAGFGSIYPCLAKLEKEELVTVQEDHVPGKPSRKVYSITAKGRQTFLTELMDPPFEDTFRSPFLLISIFAQHLDGSFIRKILSERELDLEERLSTLKQHYNDCECPASRWSMGYGIATLSASLDYLKANRSVLEEIAGGPSSQPLAAE